MAFRKAIAVAAPAPDIHAIVEKPPADQFGDGGEAFDGRPASMETALAGAGQGAKSSTFANDLR